MKLKYNIRDYTEEDVCLQADYFNTATDEYLYDLGVDPKKIREKPLLDLVAVRNNLALPINKRPVHNYAVLVDNHVCGLIILKKIHFGEQADLHVHIFNPENRKKGIISTVILDVLKQAFETFQLKRINCDPTATNKAPNILLQKLGLNVLKTEDVPAEGILRARTANHYEITREFLFGGIIMQTTKINIKLQKMTKLEYEFWYPRSIENYKKDKQQANNITEEEALDIATKDFKRFLPDGLDTKDHFLFTVKTNDETIVGYLWIGILKTSQKSKAYIFDIIIEEKFRGSGYGKETMLLAEAESKKLGQSEIGLHVFGYNKIAISLYKSLGYETTDLLMTKKI